MEPKEWKLRYLLLLCDCLIGFGCYFNIDIPSALQKEIEGKPTGNCTTGNGSHCCEDCLGLDAEQYNVLYVVYLWTNSALALPVGYLIDRIGNRIAVLLSTLTSTAGSVCFALSLLEGIKHSHFMYPLMILGRILLGAGNVSIRIVQDRAVAFWFPDRLELVFGAIVCGLRLGNVGNFLMTTNLSEFLSMQLAVWTGTIACGLAFTAAIFLALLDWSGSQKVQVYQSKSSNSPRLFSARSFPMNYWLILSVIAFFYAAYLPVVSNGGKYIRERFGYTETTASYINGASYDVAVFACPMVGVLLNHCINRYIMVIFGAFVLCLTYVLLLTVLSPPIVITALVGLAYSVVAVSIWPSIAKTVRMEYVGTAIGLGNCVQGLFGGVTSIVVGRLLEKNNNLDTLSANITRWHNTFLFLLSCAVACFCSGVVLHVANRKKINNENKTTEGSFEETNPRIQETERLVKENVDYGTANVS